LNPQAAVLHRHALHHRELIVAAMRELAHQELGVQQWWRRRFCGGRYKEASDEPASQ
jgi:hypothetical protein